MSYTDNADVRPSAAENEIAAFEMTKNAATEQIRIQGCVRVAELQAQDAQNARLHQVAMRRVQTLLARTMLGWLAALGMVAMICLTVARVAG